MTTSRADEASRGPRHEGGPAAETDAVLAACRLLVAVSVAALEALDEEVSLTQFRILLVIASRGTATLSEVAHATGLHLSKASRTCDHMVATDLLVRTDDPADRRSLQLRVTPRADQVMADVAKARRRAIVPVLTTMTPARRAELVSVLTDLTEAAGEAEEQHLWSLGWPT